VKSENFSNASKATAFYHLFIAKSTDDYSYVTREATMSRCRYGQIKVLRLFQRVKIEIEKGLEVTGSDV
jgi:hypothetical protein